MKGRLAYLTLGLLMVTLLCGMDGGCGLLIKQLNKSQLDNEMRLNLPGIRSFGSGSVNAFSVGEINQALEETVSEKMFSFRP